MSEELNAIIAKLRLTRGTALVLLLSSLGALALPSESDLGRDYFERHIRPIFIAKCLECHSGANPKSGLSLEYRKDWAKGGKRGRAIRPGQPDRSLLISVVRGEHPDLKMPFERSPLTPGEIASLVEWVRLGAYDPRKRSQRFKSPSLSAQKISEHWAFQPVRRPSLPRNRFYEWERTPVDSFVLRRLEEKGMTPSPEATARISLRRLYHDLIGLPPTMEELGRYMGGRSSDRWEQLVDRLLEDPRYGERWGRHWLDVARYADTTGYRAVGKQRKFPYSHTYRDYVLRAFNRDLPFDRFVREQLAADLLPGENRSRLAAMGFLTVGKTFLDDQPLVIDDRIDVVTRGLMGLTVQCARCHDHKSDPIPTADYYSLYGVFASSHSPMELPLIGLPTVPELHADYLSEKELREQAYATRFTAEVEKAHHRIREATGNYLLGMHEIKPGLAGRQRKRFLRERQLDPVIFEQLESYLALPSNRQHPIFQLWTKFLEGTDWSELKRSYLESPYQGRPANAFLAELFQGGSVASPRELADRYSRLFATCDTASPQPDPAHEFIRQFIRAADSPLTTPKSAHWDLVQLVREPLNALKARIMELDAEHPGAPARAMVLVDKDQLHEPVIFKRGNPSLRGDRVPRQFLAVASPAGRQPFIHGSGRLEMADAIVDPRNPLTARVFVNRVWMHHFGTPLVDSPSDFGVRSEKPTHPKLLDWMAAEFIDSGWSVKHLHRLILCSATYREASLDRPEALSLDPENRLYWKMNRRRLELEPMRDAMLYVGQQLDLRQGGLATDLFKESFNHRRTVYGFIDRANLPSFLRSFDLASPDVSTGMRIETSVPQQALFLMNSPFVKTLARKIARSLDLQGIDSEESRIRYLYRNFFQREATAREVSEGLAFVQASLIGGNYWGPVGWQYGIGKLEFGGAGVKDFKAFDHFTSEAWQMGVEYPGSDLGYARLWSDGGHTSSRADLDVVRRWTAPADGVVKITGQVSQREAVGDGVNAFIVSSRRGVLGRWHVRQSSAQTDFKDIAVEFGESIDFVCDLGTSHEGDTFKWIPVVAYTSIRPRAGQGEVLQTWRAKADFKKSFAPIPRSPTNWEQYVQVLLQANELHFID